MKPTDILAIVSSVSQESLFAAAEQLAKDWSARILVLQLAQQPEPLATDPVYAASLWAEVLKEAHERFVAEHELIKQRVAKLKAPAELRKEEVLLGTVEDVMAHYTMQTDITIMNAPESESADIAFEGALFRSGRPVVLVPRELPAAAIGKRVLIGWKPKREAARAVADAMPFLESAEKVVVATVNAQREHVDQTSGAAITALLQHKGVKAELHALDAAKNETAEMKLLQEAAAIGADLMVMGGYGHSRLREFVFGGVTRSLSRDCPIPVLMSH